MKNEYTQEIVLQGKKNGMVVLLGIIALYIAAIAAIVGGGILLDNGEGIGVVLLAPGIIAVLLGWIPACGLKVLKPQEALVLTLFCFVKFRNRYHYL